MHTKQARAILVYMRRHLVLAVAACWATASAAIVDGAARVLAAADAAAAAPVAGRTLWMYWQQGEDHLKARPAGSWYSYGHRCVDYWRRLNPGYELRLLNDTSASQLSPAYRALKRRNLPVQLMSDMLRLELLSLYGGVWADVMACPLAPLNDFAAEMTAPVGFFAYKGDYGDTNNWQGLCTKGRVDGMDLNVLPFRGAFIADTWFLIAPKPHNLLVDAWLNAFQGAVASLKDGARSGPPSFDYEYHLPHCVLNNLYDSNATFKRAYDAMPTKGYCQHKGNAVEYCNATRKRGDDLPDAKKWMYKGVQSLARMDFDSFEEQIRRREGGAGRHFTEESDEEEGDDDDDDKQERSEAGVQDSETVAAADDGRTNQDARRSFLCADAADAAKCNQTWFAYLATPMAQPAPSMSERLQSTLSAARLAELKPGELLAKVKEHPELRAPIRAAIFTEGVPIRDKLFDVKSVVDAREVLEATLSPKEVQTARTRALQQQAAEAVFYAVRDLERLADGDEEAAKRSAALLTSYT